MIAIMIIMINDDKNNIHKDDYNNEIQYIMVVAIIKSS